MISMDVGNPDTSELTENLPDAISKSALQLTEGSLPTVHQHATTLEQVQVNPSDVPVLGGYCSPSAKESDLQALIPHFLDGACTEVVLQERFACTNFGDISS